jgi:hypothetical protein
VEDSNQDPLENTFRAIVTVVLTITGLWDSLQMPRRLGLSMASLQRSHFNDFEDNGATLLDNLQSLLMPPDSA